MCSKGKKKECHLQQGNKEVQCSIVQKLMRTFSSCRNRKEDKLAIVRGNQGYFGIRKNFVRAIYS